MEGVITVGVALFAVTFIVKFPDEEKTKPSWGFLKPHELDIVIDRLNADRGDAAAEKFSWKKFLEPAKDWYIYAFALILLFVTTIAYGFAFFLPIILSTKLKFSIAMSQCLGAPPYAASGFLMYGAAWFSDKYKTRGPVLCVLCLVSLIGLPIMGFAKNPWAQYCYDIRHQLSHPFGYGIPSEQHPRAMAESFLFSFTHWYWWHRRNCRSAHLPN
jgi:hypothetical protein